MFFYLQTSSPSVIHPIFLMVVLSLTHKDNSYISLPSWPGARAGPHRLVKLKRLIYWCWPRLQWCLRVTCQHIPRISGWRGRFSESSYLNTPSNRTVLWNIFKHAASQGVKICGKRFRGLLPISLERVQSRRI